jgi:hypothetical protein
MSLDYSASGPFWVRLRDIRGAVVWESHMPAEAGEVALQNGMGFGLYRLEIRDRRGAAYFRLLL